MVCLKSSVMGHLYLIGRPQIDRFDIPHLSLAHKDSTIRELNKTTSIVMSLLIKKDQQ